MYLGNHGWTMLNTVKRPKLVSGLRARLGELASSLKQFTPGPALLAVEITVWLANCCVSSSQSLKAHPEKKTQAKIEIENVEPKTEWSIRWQKKVWCLTRLNHLLPKVYDRLPLCIGFCPALFSPRPIHLKNENSKAIWWNHLTFWGASSCPCQRQ